MLKHTELLAPAGDINKLRLAIKYGADAVYLGGKFGLRAPSAITSEDLAEAVKLAHTHNVKVYVTVNIFARNRDFEEIKLYIKMLENLKVDGVIVSDLGVLKLVKEYSALPIHISTQANVLNKYTAEEYVKLGASRIILARECSLGEIKEIADHINTRCDIEVFVHGAMCISYSGRCIMSDYMANRSANRGECAQPCRWNYSLVEEKRPNEYYPVETDERGTYILNSKDLCLLEHLDELTNAGVTSFKIEGRMKSEYYVAAVVRAYKQRDRSELEKIAHRPYTTGFVFEGKDTLYPIDTKPITTYDVAAICLGENKILQRNAFCTGDELEVLSWGDNHNKVFTVTAIKEESGEHVTRASKAGGVYYIDIPFELYPDEFLRKRSESF